MHFLSDITTIWMVEYVEYLQVEQPWIEPKQMYYLIPQGLTMP
jgi:hypothetical protein